MGMIIIIKLGSKKLIMSEIAIRMWPKITSREQEFLWVPVVNLGLHYNHSR